MNKVDAIKRIQTNWKAPIDVTFREGEQFAGRFVTENDGPGHFADLEFTIPQAEKILTHLYRIGIPYAEVPDGLARNVNEFIRALVRMNDRPKLLSHIRNNVRDLQAAVDLGVDGVNILTSVDPERIASFGFTSLGDYMNVLQQVIQTAQENHLETRVSVEHLWNGYFDKALQVFQFADALGVDRVGLPDTVGVANRWDVEDRVRQSRAAIQRTDIEVHFHNDGFLSVSNAIEALVHGANFVDTTFAGIGERSGITPLSGLLSQLHILDPGLVQKLHLEYLTPAEQEVMDMIGLPVPHNLETSMNGFTAKAGIHTKEMTRHSAGPAVYEPYAPSVIGNMRRIITGSRISGSTSAESIRVAIPNSIVQ